MSKAVFIDRDNTIIDDPGYISDPAAVKLLPGVELAIKSLAQTGFKNIVCTNQSGIARGMLTEEGLDSIHAELRRQLGDKGAHLDAIYYCPFHPQGTVEKYACESDLRKPKPGMLLKAAADLDLDLSECWMVGDSARDIEAGQRAGCRTIRVRTAGE
ncbi:MAG: HAD family hydrolase, partial [Phycisphaerae bacterium]|nr:HAD family hydrolase [Phycisphaerae bacterium]